MRKQNGDGYLGFYGLIGWWNTEFSEIEKRIILERYNPLSVSSEDLERNRLICGSLISISMSKVCFLYTLSSWFRSKEYIGIALKIIKKAEEEITNNSDILDLHFLYSHKLELYYKLRELSENNLLIAIEAC